MSRLLALHAARSPLSGIQDGYRNRVPAGHQDDVRWKYTPGKDVLKLIFTYSTQILIIHFRLAEKMYWYFLTQNPVMSIHERRSSVLPVYGI